MSGRNSPFVVPKVRVKSGQLARRLVAIVQISSYMFNRSTSADATKTKQPQIAKGLMPWVSASTVPTLRCESCS